MGSSTGNIREPDFCPRKSRLKGSTTKNMLRAGIPERVTMEIAGHKTRGIFDRYHIVSEGNLRETRQEGWKGP
jgi:hypothetical protein